MKCRADHPTRQRIAKELQGGAPLSKFDIEARCFISIRNANNYFRVMHEAGEIHIAGYRRDSPHGSPTTLWAYGPGVDAKKPKPMSAAQKTRKYREENPEKVIAEINRKRALRYKERMQRAVNNTEVLQPQRAEATCQAGGPETGTSTTGQSVSSCAV